MMTMPGPDPSGFAGFELESSYSDIHWPDTGSSCEMRYQREFEIEVEIDKFQQSVLVVLVDLV